MRACDGTRPETPKPRSPAASLPPCCRIWPCASGMGRTAAVGPAAPAARRRMCAARLVFDPSAATPPFPHAPGGWLSHKHGRPQLQPTLCRLPASRWHPTSTPAAVPSCGSALHLRAAQGVSPTAEPLRSAVCCRPHRRTRGRQHDRRQAHVRTVWHHSIRARRLHTAQLRLATLRLATHARALVPSFPPQPQ